MLHIVQRPAVKKGVELTSKALVGATIKVLERHFGLPLGFDYDVVASAGESATMELLKFLARRGLARFAGDWRGLAIEILTDKLGSCSEPEHLLDLFKFYAPGVGSTDIFHAAILSLPQLKQEEVSRLLWMLIEGYWISEPSAVRLAAAVATRVAFLFKEVGVLPSVASRLRREMSVSPTYTARRIPVIESMSYVCMIGGDEGIFRENVVSIVRYEPCTRADIASSQTYYPTREHLLTGLKRHVELRVPSLHGHDFARLFAMTVDASEERIEGDDLTPIRKSVLEGLKAIQVDKATYETAERKLRPATDST